MKECVANNRPSFSQILHIICPILIRHIHSNFLHIATKTSIKKVISTVIFTVLRNSIFHKLYPRRSMIYPASSVASNILLASVIHPAPPSLTSPQSVQQPPQPPQQPQPVNNEFRMRPSLTSHNLTHYASTSILQRSATFSAMQTDL